MTAKSKRVRATGVGAYSGSEWEQGLPLSDRGRDGQASHTRPYRTAGRDADRMRSLSSGSDPAVAFGGGAARKGDGERMGGLPLPDVVRQLLRDPSVLKWHPREEVYEVTHGENFELRCLSCAVLHGCALRSGQPPCCSRSCSTACRQAARGVRPTTSAPRGSHSAHTPHRDRA